MSVTPAKTRSPNYPVISLAEAIDRLKVIYPKQRTYPTTREVIATVLGYKGLNGASASLISALSKYGLLEGHGDKLRVSNMGQDIYLHRKGDPEYTEALRTAAFMPAFFRELRDQYPEGLPSEHIVRAALTKRGFNPKAIDGAIRAYRDTIEFVDAETGGATTSVDQPDPEMPMQTHVATSPPSPNRATTTGLPQDAGFRSVQLPLPRPEWAELRVPYPLTETDWKMLTDVLNGMKPALVPSTNTASTEQQDVAPPSQSG